MANMEHTEKPFEFLMDDAKIAGITDQRSLNLATRVYVDLSEVRGWWNVKVHTQKDLDLVFISGHPSRHEPRQLVLPVSSDTNLSPMKINQYLQQINLEDYKTDGLTLAICDSDTTTVYYKIFNGLIPPDPPEATDMKKFERFQLFQRKKADLDQSIEEFTNRMKRKQEEG